MAFRARGMALGAGALALAAAIACSGTDTSDTIIPITGITVRSETLTTGRGCGTAPGQVFKYVAVVRGWNGDTNSFDPHATKSFPTFVTAATYDCFSDATFVQLPPVPSDNGALTYRFEVFVYDQPAYAAAQGAIQSSVGGLENVFFSLPDAAARAEVQVAAASSYQELRGVAPLLTTTCTATQQQDVDVLAVCDPLQAGFAGLAGDETVPPPGVGVADAGTDAGDDGAADAAADAADAADADGG